MNSTVIKILLSLFLIFKLGYANAQSQIELTAVECRNNHKLEQLHQFKLFKEDRLIKIYLPETIMKWKKEVGIDDGWESERVNQKEAWETKITITPFADWWEDGVYIKGLKKARYTIEYQSIFGKSESRTIFVEDNKKYQIVLCKDYLDYSSEPYHPILTKLKNGEKYSIRAKTTGCFDKTDKTLSIEKKSNNYFASLKGKTKQLTNKDIEAFKRFEVELDLIGSFFSGCLTTYHEDFFITYKGNTVMTTNTSCNWFGWVPLLRQLGFMQ